MANHSARSCLPLSRHSPCTPPTPHLAKILASPSGFLILASLHLTSHTNLPRYLAPRPTPGTQIGVLTSFEDASTVTQQLADYACKHMAHATCTIIRLFESISSAHPPADLDLAHLFLVELSSWAQGFPSPNLQHRDQTLFTLPGPVHVNPTVLITRNIPRFSFCLPKL